jgi:antitoxin VapB
MAKTTVFQSGNSQAVRLPKEFRFQSKTVEIFRRGDEVVLREKPHTMGDLIKDLPNLGDDVPSEPPDQLPEPVPSWDKVK